jgi:hypothetical protein
MVSETPPHLKSCWTGTHLCSASDQLITTQLICARSAFPLLPGGARGGAEWRCVDFELGEAWVWGAWAGILSVMA